jgi:xanthine dehydrogenase YagR molybdenum-binding subunit
MRDGNHYVGWGMAAAVHPAWQFATNLTLRLSMDGSLLIRCAFHEMGMATATATAQMAAHLTGIPESSIRIEYGDSDLPIGPGAGGSGQTASVAAALIKASADLHRQLDKLKSNGGRTPAEILSRAGRTSLEVKVGGDTGLGAVRGNVGFMAKLIRDSRRWSKAASGAHFCEVRIDADTGETRVSRWVSVFDIGTVVNHKTATSQLRGGVVMGLGMALSEATLFDPRRGRIMNPSLTEYHVPVHADVPRLEIHILDDPDPTMPLGILGAGEVGIVGVGAAVANAVHHATGVRVRDLPITLDKVLPD